MPDGLCDLTLGLRLKLYRRRAGLTQTELGAKAGFSQEYLKKIEAGERLPPTETVALLADALMLEKEDRDALAGATQASQLEEIVDEQTDLSLTEGSWQLGLPRTSCQNV